MTERVDGIMSHHITDLHTGDVFTFNGHSDEYLIVGQSHSYGFSGVSQKIMKLGYDGMPYGDVMECGCHGGITRIRRFGE